MRHRFGFVGPRFRSRASGPASFSVSRFCYTRLGSPYFARKYRPCSQRGRTCCDWARLAAFSVDPENGLYGKRSTSGKLWACRHSSGLPLSVWEAERHNFHLPKLMGPALGNRWVWIYNIQVHRPQYLWRLRYGSPLYTFWTTCPLWGFSHSRARTWSYVSIWLLQS